MRTVVIDDDRVDELIELAFALNADDPEWIPPLRQPLRRELLGQDALGQYAQMRRFGCEDGGALVGRVVAIVNPRLLDPDGAVVGQLGYFECIDEIAVAQGLFDAGLSWLREQGVRRVLAPMNGGAHRMHRLMTRGFERDAFFLEPRNPPYYPRLFEACGLRAKHRWFTYELGPEDLQRVGSAMRAYARRMPTSYVLVSLDPRDPVALLARIHPILDAMWRGREGYTSFDLAEFTECMSGLLSLMQHGDTAVMHDTQSGTDVGCGLMYPDYAAQIRALQGNASSWGTWLGQTAARRLVLHTVAMSEEGRWTGAAADLVREGIDRICAAGNDSFLIALVTEAWPLFNRFSAPSREYTLYEWAASL
jgi:hypothetical protein